MEEDCEIVCEVEKTPLKSPLMKKLKQSRLPFARLDSKTPHKSSSLPTQKKRKFSGSGASGSCAKTVRSDGRRDAPVSKKKQKTQKMGKKQIGLKVAQRKEDKPVRKRKRGRTPLKEKGSSVQEDNKKLSNSSHQLMSDDEVSSSVDDEIEAPKAKKKSVEKIRKLLPLLLCKEPTQQAEISTSTEDVSDREEKENLEEVGETKNITFDKYMLQNRDNANISENESEEIEINGRKEEEIGEKGTDENTLDDDSINDKVTEVNFMEDLKKSPVRTDGSEENLEYSKTELNSRQGKEKASKGDSKSTFCNNSENRQLTEENNVIMEEAKKTAKAFGTENNINEPGIEEQIETNNERYTENEDIKVGDIGKEESVTNNEKIDILNQDIEKEENNVEDDRSKVKKEKWAEKKESELECNENEMEKNEEEEKEEKEINMENKEIKNLQEGEKDVKKMEGTNTNTQEQEEDNNKRKIPGGNEKEDIIIEGDKSIVQEEEFKIIEDDKTKDSVGKTVSKRKKEKSCGVREKNIKEVKGKITKYLNVIKKPAKEGNENVTTIKDNKDRCMESEGKKCKVMEKEEKIVEDTVAEGTEISEKEKEAMDVSTENVEEKESDRMTTTVDEEPIKNERMVDTDDLHSKTSLPLPKGPSCSRSNAVAHMGPKKNTAVQKRRETKKQLEMREKQKHERQKKKLEVLAEKEKRRKEREEEWQKQKEEKERIKEDMKRKRQEELDAKRQKKEEDLQRKEEEKRVKEEEKRLKEEEKRLKEEEKRQKEEAKKQAEEEKQRQKDKLKKKFASFFVAKKRDPAEMKEERDNGVFKQFRVKEDMQMAPRSRSYLSEDQRLELDSYISGNVTSSKLYLNILKSGNYVKQKSECTWPPKDKKGDMDDIEIIEEEEDMGNMDGMIEDTVAGILKGKHLKAKFLSFCENRRPAYRGTWSKHSSSVSARQPFAKHDTFDYEYDSDDDWEEEEAGESLSDSEGEEKEEEEGNQYEVDNEFFVPHAYLSDDEGRSDEEDAASDKSPMDDHTRHKEKLKQKQAEFEEEMKKKTRQLKPRILGCLWMADANNNPAYSQLLKILNSYKVVNLCSGLPIGISRGGLQPMENKDRKLEEEGVSEDKSTVKQKFVKTFPEEAVPSLIQLLHGNRHGKVILSREFSDYWRKKRDTEGNCFIAKRKVEFKIQELGQWRKCPDEGPFHKVMMWYVPKEVREKYGLAELTQPNAWNYINKPKERREINFEDTNDTEEGSKTSKTGKLIPITAFAKKLTQTPVSTSASPTSPTDASPQKGETPKSDTGSPSAALSTSSPSVADNSDDTSPSSTTKVSSGKSISTSGQQKKKVALLSVARGQEITSAQQASFASFFKMSGDTPPGSSVDFEKEEKNRESEDNEQVECITLE